MTLLLLQREGLLPFVSPPHSAVRPLISRPIDSWMGVYLPGNVRIGFVNTNITPDSRGGGLGTSLSLTARLRITALAMPLEVYITGSAWLPQETGLADFDFNVRSGEHTMRIAATVSEGILNAKVFTAGEEIPFQFPVDKDVLLSGAMGTTTFNVPALRPGQEVLIDTFDPMTLSMGRARVKCVGQETLDVLGERVKTKIVTTSLQGTTSKMWITDDEEVMRAETPFGFSLRKITPQEALSPFEDSRAEDLLTLMAVHPAGPRPFRGAKRMTMRLTGISPERYPPTDETQTSAGNEYTVTMAPEPSMQSAEDAASEDAPAEFLRSDTFAQADHPKIIETARGIVQEEGGRWQRALRVYEWVYKSIVKTAVISVPSALEVLETRQGDCNEHTILYTALARAAGIPTRIAIGVVWSDDLDAFYYHAWPEVYIGRWIWMDPTLGQPVADATHVKLLNGNIETWPQLIPYLGSLQIEVIAIE